MKVTLHRCLGTGLLEDNGPSIGLFDANMVAIGAAILEQPLSMNERRKSARAQWQSSRSGRETEVYRNKTNDHAE